MSLGPIAHRPVATGYVPPADLNTPLAVASRPAVSERKVQADGRAARDALVHDALAHDTVESDTWPTYLDFDAAHDGKSGAGMAQYLPAPWSPLAPALAANASGFHALHQLAQAYRYAILLC